MESERCQKGKERLAAMGHNSPIENVLLESAPDLAKYIYEFAFGDMHSRPGLTMKQREISIIASLTTLGHAKIELESHINMALNIGVTREEILEVIMQMAVYAGFPAAVNGVYVARDVFDKHDKAVAQDTEKRDG